MKRNSGLFAGVLVALTFLGVTNLPKNSESPGATEPGKSTPPSKGKASVSQTKRYAACDELADRLQRFVSGESGPSRGWKLPGSCYEPEQTPTGIPPQPLPDVRFAIATVPNPVSTHLPLLFDRTVEAIQQAAQDEGYSYDDSWFPWEAAAKDYTFLLDQQAAEELRKIQQNQLGVIVFRQALAKKTDDLPYNSGLVVFLVGEKPTGGINDEQFHSALEWIALLGGIPDTRPLRILGPMFSGSLPSLRRALEREPAASQAGIHISSGTVSSGLGYRWFNSWIKERKDGSYFRTALENDSLTTDRFCQYLTDQDYDLRKVAFLSEDETAYGTDRGCSLAMQLYYPRDIATLRSAYQQQSILGPAKSQSNANTPSTTLRGDLSEPAGSDHDTVRTYAGQLTPLAQEAVLLDITNRLSEKRIQFIVLRSTSSLDQIFLAEFLRRSYPEGRVVIDGADLLFTRGAEGRSLLGVMLLSTYPLLVWQQDWTRHTRSYRTFGEGNSEGVYIAARGLFRNQPVVPIPDYTAPEWARGPHDSPATWLSVIGRRQFWPLAVLNSNTLPTLKNRDAKSILGPLERDGLPSGDVEPELLRIPTIMWLFVIACAAWSGLHLYFCLRGSIIGSPRARAYFAPSRFRQHPALIAFGSLLPAMLAVAVAAASGLFSWYKDARLYQEYDGVLLALLVLVSLLLSAVACMKNYRLKPSCASDPPITGAEDWHSRIAWAAVLCLALYAGVHMFLISKLTQANRFPAYLRGVNLLSGVSPLLPQLLLIAGAYLWFWCTLRGLAHFGDDRPRLPMEKDLTGDDGKLLMPMFGREKAGDQVEEAARPITWRYLITLVIVLVAGAGVCLVALEGTPVRTLGESAFGKLISISVSLCIAVAIADGIEMWLAWSELRRLLVYLDRLRLRRTLRALKGLEWGSIWKLSGNVLGERYRVISLQFESLRHLANAATEWDPDNPSDLTHRDEVLSQVSQCQEKGKTFAEWFVELRANPEKVENLTALRDFQEELASTAGLVMTRVLMPAWQKEKESLIFDRSGPEAKPGEAEVAETALSTAKLAPHVQAAEEFFVLPYLAFIQNILGRLRTIALGIIWLFLGATLAVSSYPFDPLNVLAGIFLAVFLIVGGLVVLAYSQMSRDATLSHITNTRPGELGGDFWMRIVAFGIGPLIGLLTTLFPSITDFVFSWLQPGVQALK